MLPLVRSLILLRNFVRPASLLKHRFHIPWTSKKRKDRLVIRIKHNFINIYLSITGQKLDSCPSRFRRKGSKQDAIMDQNMFSLKIDHYTSFSCTNQHVYFEEPLFRLTSQYISKGLVIIYWGRATMPVCKTPVTKNVTLPLVQS